MKQSSLNAVSLNRLLIAGLVLLIGASLFGCYTLQKFLSARALEANHIKIDVEHENEERQELGKLKTYLAEHQDDINRAAQLTAGGDYQRKIVDDLNGYAAIAQVKVLGFDFVDPAAPTTPVAKGGTKTVQVSVNLQNPVDYRAFLTFLKLIEQNLTKMQITDVSVTPFDGSPDRVNSPVVKLEVYIP